MNCLIDIDYELGVNPPEVSPYRGLLLEEKKLEEDWGPLSNVEKTNLIENKE